MGRALKGANACLSTLLQSIEYVSVGVVGVGRALKGASARLSTLLQSIEYVSVGVVSLQYKSNVIPVQVCCCSQLVRVEHCTRMDCPMLLLSGR